MYWFRKLYMDRTKSVVFYLLLFCAFFSTQVQAQDSIPAIKIFAHRGFTENQPENSLGAIKAAIDLGLDGCEVDIRTTKDNKIVLMHDATILRMTGQKGQISQMTWDSLRSISLRKRSGKISRQKIPSLEQALALLPANKKFRIALDMKAVNPAELGKLILDKDLTRQVVFCPSGCRKTLDAKALKKVSCKLYVSYDLGYWWKIEGLPTFAAQAIPADALFAPEWNFPRWGFFEAKEAGAEVMVFLWGKKDLLKRAKKARDLGAQVISCDFPKDILSLRKP